MNIHEALVQKDRCFLCLMNGYIQRSVQVSAKSLLYNRKKQLAREGRTDKQIISRTFRDLKYALTEADL